MITIQLQRQLQPPSLGFSTEWALDLAELAAAMRGETLVDLRNVYDRADVERAGLTYHGIGRGAG